MSSIEAAGRWYLSLVAVTWAFAPATRSITSRLPDRGATIARPLSLLAFVYPAWLLASPDVVPFGRATLVATAVPIAAAGWLIAIRRRWISRSWLGQLLTAEAAGLLTFTAYLWLCGFKPDIFWGEKPMDAAFLASSARTDSIPPPDPWLSGEPINYYYLGHLLPGVVMRMAGVGLGHGFNLSTATAFSMAAVACAGLGFNTVRPWWSRSQALTVGIVAPLLLLVAGNMLAPKEVLLRPTSTLAADWRTGVGWYSARVVHDAGVLPGKPPRPVITEFPFFSFLLGDPHAHVLALPFTLAALSLVLLLLLTGLDGRDSWWTFAGASRIAAAGFVVGALYPMNSWDYPTYFAISLIGLLIALRGTGWRFRALAIGGFSTVSVVAWLPFTLAYDPPAGFDASGLPSTAEGFPVVQRIVSVFRLVTWERTSLGEFLTMFGIPFAIAVCFLGLLLLKGYRSGSSHRHAISIVVLIGGLVILSANLGAPLILWCGVPLVAALWLLGTTRRLCPETIATSAFAIGFILIMVIEFVCIRDANRQRTNTVFKVYFQVWVLFSVASAIGLMVVWFAVRRTRIVRAAFLLACIVAAAAALTYPAIGTYRWTDGFDDWRGIDGLAYVGDWSADELAALRWLQGHAEHSDIVLEAAGCSKLPRDQVPSSRVSTFTGIPTVIGWGGHERIWRRGRPNLNQEIKHRQEDVRQMYLKPSGPEIAGYGVTLLYLGRYEKSPIPRCDVAGPYPGVSADEYPGPGWVQVFASGEVRIFRRQDASG
jgi:YYY domain-containing protein